MRSYRAMRTIERSEKTRWIQKRVAKRREGQGSSRETRKWKKTKAPEAWKGFQL